MAWLLCRPSIRFCLDESSACRLATNEIQFFDPKDFSKGITSRIRVPGVAAFELSKTPASHVAVFVPESKVFFVAWAIAFYFQIAKKHLFFYMLNLLLSSHSKTCLFFILKLQTHHVHNCFLYRQATLICQFVHI